MLPSAVRSSGVPSLTWEKPAAVRHCSWREPWCQGGRVLRSPEERRNHGMIVACSACSARFRVADEKVGPRGARIRCTRCGKTFAVSPPPPPAPVAPPEPPATTSEATGTGGWPTGILEVQGTSAAEIGTPAAVSLEGDPFATFAGVPDGASRGPTPPAPARREPPAGAAARSGFLASPSVTNLSDLERTGAVPI